MTHAQLIARMEHTGEMDQRREKLRAWFAEHPKGSIEEALAAFPEFTLKDHMRVIADTIWTDLGAGAGAGEPDQLARLRRALKQYPEITIARERDGQWSARVRETTLTRLLDRLRILLQTDGW